MESCIQSGVEKASLQFLHLGAIIQHVKRSNGYGAGHNTSLLDLNISRYKNDTDGLRFLPRDTEVHHSTQSSECTDHRA